MSQEFPERAWILITGLDFAVYDFWTVGVNDLGQSETSDVTEQQPIRRPSKITLITEMALFCQQHSYAETTKETAKSC